MKAVKINEDDSRNFPTTSSNPRQSLVARFTRQITTPIKKTNNKSDIAVIILSAGVGNRIKSNEPRSLIKIGGKTLIEHQINFVENNIEDAETIGVFGYSADKIIKKIAGKIRIVENQIFDKTNNSESLRLAVNNTNKKNILFFHGDLYFNHEILRAVEKNYCLLR